MFRKRSRGLYGPRRGRGGSRGGRSRGRGRGGNRSFRKTPYQREQTTGAAKIIITNLDSEVTESDIKEIFGKIGRVTKAIVNYDGSGNSRGTGEVSFATQNNAAKAVAEYDRAEVDGRPMYLKLEGTATEKKKTVVVQPKQVVKANGITPRVRATRSITPARSRTRGRSRSGSLFAKKRTVSTTRRNYTPRGRRTSGNRGRGRRTSGSRGRFTLRSRGRGRGGRGRGRRRSRGRGGRGGRGGTGRRISKSPSKTAEQLDQEMEDYHSKAAGDDDDAGAGQPVGFAGQPPAFDE